MIEKSYSENFQDVFVLSLMKNVSNGFFIDIGSGDPIKNNNTFLLEKYEWKGLCIELDEDLIENYKNRKCLALATNALKLNYINCLKYLNFPKEIDYLSLDIDDDTTKLLNLIPFQDYVFKIITIEHDFYLHGTKYQTEQRNFLIKNGYKLIYGNVYTEKECDIWGRDRAYEDWWIHPNYINFFNNEFKENIYPSEILKLIQTSI